MQLRTIAWASLRRRKARLGFLVVALTLGIGTVVALVSLSRAMEAAIGEDLDRFGANIIITPKSRSLDLAYGGLALGGLTVDAQALTIEALAPIRAIPNHRNVRAVAPSLVGTAEVEKAPVLLVGTIFHEERAVKNWWQVNGRFAAQADEVMLGAEAAARLRKGVGDVVDLGDGPRHVVGLIGPTGALEDQAIVADLTAVQRRLGLPGAVSFVEVSALCRGCPIEDMVAQIGAVIPQARVAPIQQAIAAREHAVLQFTKFAYGVSIVVLLVGGLVVMTTMMASVTERTQEIGVLRAVGFRRTQVARVILLEAVAVGLAAGLTGWAAGTLAVRTLGPWLTESAATAPLDPIAAIAAPMLAMLLGTAGGAYPALRAARMDPSQSLRHL